MTVYLTDGRRLYEIVARRDVTNYGTHERSQGRHGPRISYTIIMDSMSETTVTLDDLTLATLTEVRITKI